MIGKFLFKVIYMALLMINDVVASLPELPVRIATDWLAIIVVGLLSGLSAVAGVYLGIKLSLKSFYSQRWWDRKADAYVSCLDSIHIYHSILVELEAALKLHNNGQQAIQSGLSQFVKSKNLDTCQVSDVAFKNKVYLSPKAWELLRDGFLRDFLKSIQAGQYKSAEKEVGDLLNELYNLAGELEKVMLLDLGVSNNKK